MAEHFGNPLLEQRKLQAGEAYVERVDQCVIRVSGPDAKSWLHSLLTQDILNLSNGESTEALLLSPQGHIEQQLKIVIDGDDVLIALPKERVNGFVSWLEKMRFRSKVSIEQTSLKSFGLFGKPTPGAWQDPFSIERSSSVSYNPNRANFNYFEIFSETAPTKEPAGLMAFRALRIAAGRPDIVDVDDKSLPHEFDWLLSAIHLSKGCYRGQESVSKVHNLGHPPRRLTILNLENGDDLATVGDLVFYQEKQVGKVVAAALHYELGSIALALVARNTPYLDLLVESGARKVFAAQHVLVPADAGKAANLPRPSSFKLSGRSS